MYKAYYDIQITRITVCENTIVRLYSIKLVFVINRRYLFFVFNSIRLYVTQSVSFSCSFLYITTLKQFDKICLKNKKNHNLLASIPLCRCCSQRGGLNFFIIRYHLIATTLMESLFVSLEKFCLFEKGIRY